MNTTDINNGVKAVRKKIKEMEAHNTPVNDWIDVNKELPTEGKSVLVYRASVKDMFVLVYSDGAFRFLGEFHGITHWRALPEPPIS